jgi:hypothetical protein
VNSLFFEPGESTKMLRVVRLEPGDYLFKATFVGADERDFYTRTVFAHVPTDVPHPGNTSIHLGSVLHS